MQEIKFENGSSKLFMIEVGYYNSYNVNSFLASKIFSFFYILERN